MTQVQFEKKSIEWAYSLGEISYEEYSKLMDDITPELWDDLFDQFSTNEGNAYEVM